MAQQITRVRPVTQSHFFRNTGIGLATVGIVAGSMTSANAFASAAPSSTSTTPQIRPSLAVATSSPVAHTFVDSQASASTGAAPAVQQPVPAPTPAPATSAPQAPWAQQPADEGADSSTNVQASEPAAAPAADTATQAPAPEAVPAAETAPASGSVDEGIQENPIADDLDSGVEATNDSADAPIEAVPAAETTPQQQDPGSEVADQAQLAPVDQPQSADTLSAQATDVQPVASTDTVTGSRGQIVQDALSGVGGSYVWGGQDYMAWDCSGFVSYVYAQSGINLDAYTYSMKDQLVPTSAPQAGDVVFTNNYAHVGIYLGDGQMVSALNPEQGTQITAVDGGGMMTVDGYYAAPGL
ncbi:C40 family peptidase [Rothia uropygialis]|uniref:C40 family peptidase n=1 Tax=Kocuria sp. 36 TaxID=1415402 RepID=UPI001EE92B86|nr:C40 family peptidase [Kocuria sp. 36]